MLSLSKPTPELWFSPEAIACFSGRPEFNQEVQFVNDVVSWLNTKPEAEGLFAQYGIVLGNISSQSTLSFFEWVYRLIYETESAFRLATSEAIMCENVYAEIGVTTYPLSVIGYVYTIVNEYLKEAKLETIALPDWCEI